MLSKQEEQQDRREVLRNDAKVRGATFSDFAQAEASEARGRFTAHERSTVIGSAPSPASAYPAGPAWTCDPVGPEMPLGYSVEDHEPVGEPAEIRASIASLGPTPAQAPPGRSHISSVQATKPNSASDVNRAGYSNRTTATAGAGLGSFSRTYRRF
jgi:hypothetical protein